MPGRRDLVFRLLVRQLQHTGFGAGGEGGEAGTSLGLFGSGSEGGVFGGVLGGGGFGGRVDVGVFVAWG